MRLSGLAILLDGSGNARLIPARRNSWRNISGLQWLLPNGLELPRDFAIADLIGSVTGLPTDLSSQKKAYLKTTGYGQKRTR